MQPLMSANGICKYYQMGDITVEALKNVSFDIFEGEFIVVLGPSGSGKSTLLNIIGGMDGASAGELDCDGIKLNNANEKALTEYRRNSVGFVFQFYNLIPNLTAYENVKLSADISKAPLDSASALEIVELSDRMEHFPSQMSGGQQQRVAIELTIFSCTRTSSDNLVRLLSFLFKIPLSYNFVKHSSIYATNCA